MILKICLQLSIGIVLIGGAIIFIVALWRELIG